MDKWVETQTVKRGNCVVTVHRPMLTPDEHAKRMAAVKKAAENVVRATMRIHRKEEQHGNR